MVGKLSKKDDIFYLFVDASWSIASTDAKDNRDNKLSLKNCEEVERGYDLDTEVENIVKTIVPDDRGKDIWYGTSMAVGKQCFKKALEILGDKKFSEGDVRIAMDRVWDWCEDDKDKDCSSMTELRNKHIQLLQQTEWDVEIVMGDPIGIGDKYTPDTKPKLDEDGCLILRKI